MSKTSPSATTTWEREPATGRVSTKRYAGGDGTSYTYDARGQLTSPIWARGLSTSTGTSYNAAGNLTGVDYSAPEPSPIPTGRTEGLPPSPMGQGSTSSTTMVPAAPLPVRASGVGSSMGCGCGRALFPWAGGTRSAPIWEVNRSRARVTGTIRGAGLQEIASATLSANYSYAANSDLIATIIGKRGGHNRADKHPDL